MVQPPSKAMVAKRLAEAHYALDPGIELIVELKADAKRERATDEPIKLLEVNRSTVPTGIQPLFFGPHRASGIMYPSVIIEVTPNEYQDILKDRAELPNGWQIGSKFAKPARAIRR
jgi:hypothetical protein